MGGGKFARSWNLVLTLPDQLRNPFRTSCVPRSDDAPMTMLMGQDRGVLAILKELDVTSMLDTKRKLNKSTLENVESLIKMSAC